ncbi:MAG: 5'-3' exonuclease H3TH domain-containing protein, partial [Myxococcota bacterium]
VFVGRTDKDFAQCVNDRVVMWDRMRDAVYDRDGVIEKWGVVPESIPDYLALVGDSADGIPGVPKWGAKSSAVMLSHYVTIDAIPKDYTQWQVQVRGAKGLAQSLETHREAAALYKTLATLRTDAPVSERLEEIRLAPPNKDELRAIEAEFD